MSAVGGVARTAYYFFVEDGSIAIGTIIAMVVVGIIGHAFSGAAGIVGPLLFLAIALLLVTNLLRMAQQARARK